MTDWVILRCSNCKTLELAASLTEVGFEAWAPVDWDENPMTAGYVFAKAAQIHSLLELSHSPSLLYRVWDTEQQKMVTKGHPYFRLMPRLGTAGGWARVSDLALRPIREIERRRKPRGVVKTIAVGAIVRLQEGGFAGLDGVVESVRNKFATVTFEGLPVPVQIGCWLLTEKVDATPAVNVNSRSTERPSKAA